MKRALISVSDKTGVAEFAKALAERGFEILSTGGTKKLLEEQGLSVTAVDEVTGFPEILEGRVKTLHPFIHGGLLAKRDEPGHAQQLAEQGITPIDIVCVNLYPFKKTISKPDVSFDEAIENIDIGGPAMLRASAKNHEYVTVLIDSEDYGTVLAELDEEGEVSRPTKQRLAAKVFRHTAAYDALIAGYLTEKSGEEFPEQLTFTYDLKQNLRYGENPHQHAAFYERPLSSSFSIAKAKQLHGKELSYNNIRDANTALQIAGEFKDPAAVAVKHMNPCGVGTGKTAAAAFQKAYEADPVSIFGGIIALNREVDKETAEKLKEIFLEIIIAPGFTDDALGLLTEKKNLRLLEIPFQEDKEKESMLTSVKGGLLIQDEDALPLDEASFTVPTERKPSNEEWAALKFAWNIVKHVKSNAIVIADDEKTLGVGAGQMNRVGAAKIAIEQAGTKADGAVLASDAFFPMGDTVEEAAKAGIKAIIQPGGSIKDEDSIKAADKHGIAMVFTGVRHFKH